ncbi:DUF4012 domain-containing protein [Nocardioides sp.]|uniref:DUF4012 domain-containing protein n=1 Tax=Nocardioides sp. TaxID=35761 RepID=UPI0035194140
MHRFRVLRLTLVGLAVVVVLGGAWAGWQAWQVVRDLREAVDQGRALQDALAGDATVSADDPRIAALRASSAAAAERTSTPTWKVLTHLPVVGDDASGVQATSAALDVLARRGVGPMIETAGQLDAVLPSKGGVDLAVVQRIAGPVAQAEEAFAEARALLDGEQPSGYVAQLQSQFVEFRDRVDDAATGLRSAEVATRVLPAMLGGDGTRHYLLVFQNNAEVRATGGLPGSVSYLQAADGRVSLRQQVSGGSFGGVDRPVLPLSSAERSLYSDIVGQYFLDANMTPDVPRAADLMRARWNQRFPASPVDGVVLVDAVAVSYLLDATGSITVDDLRLTGDNVVDELLHRTYLRLPRAADQDAFFARVAQQTFDRFSAGFGDPKAAFSALGRAVRERRLVVHSFDEATDETLAASTIGGDPMTATAGTGRPQLDLTVNDTTGSKMSYFLRFDATALATSCRDDRQAYTVRARVRSIAPRDAARLPRFVTGGGNDGAPPGGQIVTLRLFGPQGGRISSYSVDGVASETIDVLDDGRPVAMSYLTLSPGQSIDLSWAAFSGPGQTAPTDLRTTPSIEPGASADVLPSVCGRGGE